jgi:membrane protease YdiL (CAAX protease family)
VKKYDPRVSDILGVALIALALMEILFALLTARTVPSIFPLLIAVLLQLPMYFVPVFFVVFAYKRLRWSMPELAREMDYNRRAMLTVSTFGGIVIMQTLYAAVFPSTVPSVGVKDAESLLAFLLLSFSSVVLPAMLEELFFRGIVAAEYERRGGVRAVIMSTLLFALCHFDLHNLPVYLFSGVLFMLVLLATDSLVATMLLHACYNLVSLLGQRYLNAFYDITGSIELFLFALILILLISLVLFFRFAAGLYRERAESGLLTPRRAVPYNVQFYTTLDALCDPPLLLTVALSVVGIILL